jgi:glycosyltransferase involved in cell wall biosynthesis
MRVAFTLSVDESWIGGLNYLRNLFSALGEVPGRPVEPVLFLRPGTARAAYAPLLPYLPLAPIEVPAWRSGGKARALKLLRTLLTRTDSVSVPAFRAAGIDLVFDNDVWYGSRFPLPVLGWIADFQHCHLQQLFTRSQRALRTAKYTAFCRSATRVMVSSEDAGRDCATFFPASRGKISVVPFAVQLDDGARAGDPWQALAVHGLPRRYLYLPAQLWRHKNHLVLLEALRLLKAAGRDVVVVATGSPNNRHHPDHPAQVFEKLRRDGLEASFRFLGHVPHEHIMPLMRAATAVVNPSLFEGWSTTVEEAKALGVPLLLSDLRVHREQAPAGTRFFDPGSASSMAAVLAEAWDTLVPGPDLAREEDAGAGYRQQRQAFGRRFVEVVRETVAAHEQVHPHAAKGRVHG